MCSDPRSKHVKGSLLGFFQPFRAFYEFKYCYLVYIYDPFVPILSQGPPSRSWSRSPPQEQYYASGNRLRCTASKIPMRHRAPSPCLTLVSCPCSYFVKSRHYPPPQPPPPIPKTRRAPSRHCRRAGVYGHTMAATNGMSTPPPIAVSGGGHTGKHISEFHAVILPQESPPHKRFSVGRM